MAVGLLRVVGDADDVDALAREPGACWSASRRPRGSNAWLEPWTPGSTSSAPQSQKRRTSRSSPRAAASTSCSSPPVTRPAATATTWLHEAILEVLAEAGSARPGELADALGQSRPRVVSSLEGLRAGGVELGDAGAAMYRLAGTAADDRVRGHRTLAATSWWQTRPHGGTGRRARLKPGCRKASRFDSGWGHQPRRRSSVGQSSRLVSGRSRVRAPPTAPGRPPRAAMRRPPTL